jgi:hypothetical protein
MLGFGYGKNFMVVRLALLAAVILAGVGLHHHGSAYGAVRLIYYVAIIAMIGFFMVRRSSARRSQAGMAPAPDPSRRFPSGDYPPPGQIPYGGYPDAQGEYPFPSGQYSQPQYERAPYPQTYQSSGYPQDGQQGEGSVAFGYSAPASAAGPQPGWYPDPTDVNVQHYWDGSGWISRQRWDGTQWLPD